MNRFRNLTITTKLTLLFILFAALILIGVGAPAYFSGRAALEQAVISDLESTANEKQAALNRWLDDRLNLVVSITGFPAYRARVNSLIYDKLDDAARKTLQSQTAQALAGFTGPNGNYTEMMIVEARQGQVIVSTQPGNQGKFNEDRPYFIEGLKGPFVQKIIYSLDERAPMLVVAAPLKADDGSVIAVLAARLKLDEMNEIILRRTGQRETDDALLVDPSNLFVTQPRFITDPAVLQRGVHTEQVNRCLAGNSGVLAANDYRGVPVLAVYRWMPERQLCLIVKIDQQEAFASSNAFGQTLALIGVATLVLASLSGFALARTITRPIQQLVQATHGIGAGKLDTRIDVKSRDEIGQLAGAFVQMTENLRKSLVSRDDLLKEVEERKRAEETLATSEVRYRRLFEAARDGILILNAETGIIVDVNPFLIELLGFPREEFMEKKIWDLGFFKDIAANQDSFAELQQKEYIRYENLPLETADGRRIAVEFVSYVYQVNRHKVIQCNVRDITERKQVEESLRESEELFRALFENAVEAMFLTVPDGRITAANPAACQMFDWTERELIEGGRATIVDAADPRLGILLKERIEKGKIHGELTYLRRDGTRFPGEVTSALYRDKDGNQRTSMIIRDITERKRSEQALQQSEEKYRALFENAQVGMYRTKIDGSAILDVNQNLLDIFGFTREEMLASPSTMRWAYPEEREKMALRLRADGVVTNLGVAFITKTGDLRDFLISVKLYPEQGVLEGTGLDITDRKQAEAEIRKLNTELEQRVVERTAQLQTANKQLESELAERRRAEEALRESEDRFRRLSEAAFEAIIIHEGGVLLSTNTQYPEMFGYELEELLGKQVMPLTIAPEAIESVRKEIATGGVGPYESIGLRKDGTKFPMEIRVREMEYKGRKVRVAAIMDITEHKRAEEALLQRTAQLEAANKELEAFAYSVSHDLRSPLRAVDGFSRILLEEYADKLDAEGKRLLNVVRTNTQRMDQLITDLLTLSRITRGEMQFSHIDMTTLVHTVYHEIASPQAQETFAFSVAPLPDAFGDPTLLRQVWSNLISNAVKYTMPKNERRIEIDCRVEDGMNVYFVKDTGVGFNPDYTHKLFGVFQRLHTTKEFEGNGVGLAIVQRIVHRHGGRVWAEGQVNQGATFYFALPQK